MPTLNQTISLALALGGESKAFDFDQAINIAGKTCYDRMFNIAGGATIAVLWNSSAVGFTAFGRALIVADPDRVRDTDQVVDITVTNNSVTHVYRVGRDEPIMLGRSAQGTGAVTAISATAVGTVSGTDDVVVRIFLLPP